MKLELKLILYNINSIQALAALNTSFLSFAIIIKALSSQQVNCIISLLQIGHLCQEIAHVTSRSIGVIIDIHKKYLPYLLKSSRGWPTKYS
jgi:hypothetical protein